VTPGQDTSKFGSDATQQLKANEAAAQAAKNPLSQPGPKLVRAPGGNLGGLVNNPNYQLPPGFGPQPSGASVSENTLVNDPTRDGATSGFSQNETTNLAFPNSTGNTSVLVAYNDSQLLASMPGARHGIGYSLSTDGGKTFTELGPLPASQFGDLAHPALARDDVSGNIYLSSVSFTSSPAYTIPGVSDKSTASSLVPAAISFFTSADGGNTFSTAVNSAPGFTQGDLLDKDWLTVDNFPGPGQGTIYQTFTDLTTYKAVGLYLTTSADGGHTWGPSGGTLIATGSVQGSFVASGPDHSVSVSYWDGNQFPERLIVRTSHDGGATFGPTVVVATLNTFGDNGDLGLGSFRSNAFPHVAVNPVSGAIYVAYNDSNNKGDRSDIYLTQSEDGDNTRSKPVQVNDDSTTNDHWQPAIAVNATGSRLFLGWYDRRLDPNNYDIDFYGAVGHIDATTGAVTFEPNFRITNQSFPVAVNIDPESDTYYMGDYDTASALGDAFYATWGDNRLLNQTGAFNQPDVRFAQITTGLTVVNSTPADGSVVSSAPSDITLTLSDPADPASVNANPGALTVDGTNASGVSEDATNTILIYHFTSPISGLGLHRIQLAADAFTRASDGVPNDAFDAQFRYDPNPITVVSSSPASGADLPSALTSVVLTFSKVFDPASIRTSNLVLSQGTVTAVSVDSTDTIATYTISGTSEGPETFTLPAGAVTDPLGDPLPSAFSATAFIDLALQAYPTPLTGQPPTGGLIYDPSIADGIFYAGDKHGYTIDLNTRQTIAIVLQVAGTLQGNVVVTNPNGAVFASASTTVAGQEIFIQAARTITLAGTYTITVTGNSNSTGTYTLQLVLNAALEADAYGARITRWAPGPPWSPTVTSPAPRSSTWSPPIPPVRAFPYALVTATARSARKSITRSPGAIRTIRTHWRSVTSTGTAI
jgi:hypothetical protein